MIKTFIIETGQKLTEEQLAEISEAKKNIRLFLMMTVQNYLLQ